MARSRLHKKNPITYIILIVLALIFLVPAYMTIITAFKDPADINLSTAWIPPLSPDWAAFIKAVREILPSFANSLILTGSATLLSVCLGSINGFVFSKKAFRGSEIIFTLFIFGMFIPYEIILIPLFQILSKVGLYGGLAGLIGTHIIYGIPIVTLLFRNYYDQIDDALVEAANMDGTGYFSLYFRIFLPLSAPCFVVGGIWQFTQIWNEFLWGITLTTESTQPITVKLSKLAGGEAVKWNEPMAGAIIAAIPVVLIMLFLGKYFIRGLLAGSVKQ
ncbi:MAG: carbohydrate ABC transporter permease [Deltaproteobacteria bacterium]|nr:carbohydrate ABC transporter permease [Deltaproteobacteria bacterium]